MPSESGCLQVPAALLLAYSIPGTPGLGLTCVGSHWCGLEGRWGKKPKRWRYDKRQGSGQSPSGFLAPSPTSCCRRQMICMASRSWAGRCYLWNDLIGRRRIRLGSTAYGEVVAVRIPRRQRHRFVAGETPPGLARLIACLSLLSTEREPQTPQLRRNADSLLSPRHSHSAWAMQPGRQRANLMRGSPG